MLFKIPGIQTSRVIATSPELLPRVEASFRCTKNQVSAAPRALLRLILLLKDLSDMRLLLNISNLCVREERLVNALDLENRKKIRAASPDVREIAAQLVRLQNLRLVCVVLDIQQIAAV